MSSESLQSQLNQGLLVKHPEFWFSDGSLILCAQSTLFRVHISQLCRKSVFFRDLFSLPQPSPSDANERQLEGCPVLDLHDSSEDVANLVRVIYDGPYVYSFFMSQLSFLEDLRRSSVSGPPSRYNSTYGRTRRSTHACSPAFLWLARGCPVASAPFSVECTDILELRKWARISEGLLLLAELRVVLSGSSTSSSVVPVYPLLRKAPGKAGGIYWIPSSGHRVDSRRGRSVFGIATLFQCPSSRRVIESRCQRKLRQP